MIYLIYVLPRVLIPAIDSIPYGLSILSMFLPDPGGWSRVIKRQYVSDVNKVGRS